MCCWSWLGDSMMWGGEWRQLGGLQLQNCCVLPVPCSWGGRKPGAGKAARLCLSQPWHRLAHEGVRELAWWGRGGNLGCQGSSYSQPHPSLALLNKTWWSDAGAGSVSTPVCFLATAGRALPHGHPPRLEEGILWWPRACPQHQLLQQPRGCLWCDAGDGQPAGQERAAPQAGGYPCARAQGGTGRPWRELPFSAPWCGASTSPCLPCPSCSHPSPSAWLTVLWLSFSLTGLMQG